MAGHPHPAISRAFPIRSIERGHRGSRWVARLIVWSSVIGWSGGFVLWRDSVHPRGRCGEATSDGEDGMGQVIANASMSLDGYIAKDDNTIGRLFDWLQNGTVEVVTASGDITFHMSASSAEYWRRWLNGVGALVCGRTLFDFTEGWGGRHTIGVPVVVVTHEVPADWVKAHPEAPFHFVTEGVPAAVAKAQAIAEGGTVAVTAGTIARQCLELGLLDAVAVDLVPVVMGTGRPYFGQMPLDDVPLGDPTVCIQGDRVTHLVFPVTKTTSGGRG
jgi:dihydrofolate reductase